MIVRRRIGVISDAVSRHRWYCCHYVYKLPEMYTDHWKKMQGYRCSPDLEMSVYFIVHWKGRGSPMVNL